MKGLKHERAHPKDDEGHEDIVARPPRCTDEMYNHERPNATLRHPNPQRLAEIDARQGG